MTLARTKVQFSELLLQNDLAVIALSGKWGTGKTHLWTEVKKNSEDSKVQNALYVSLFGLSSIEQIKRKLIECSVPGVEANQGIFDGVRHFWDIGVKVVSEHYKSLAAINDMNLLLVAPVILREKVIVIDDIERKHEKLGIDEILGFIDEYSKQHKTRFVLVLNDDQLFTKDEQKVLWETFREKVIDQEIKLLISPEEAFSIAIELNPSKYADSIKRAANTCLITNIRILSKIIKVIKNILEDRDLDNNVLERVVPSIVLFTAIHYRGLIDGPDFNFALNIGNPDWSKHFKDEDAPMSAEEEREKRWENLMYSLGIPSCDIFEKYLVEFLESGLIDREGINQTIGKFIQEKEAMQARSDAHAYIFRTMWDHRISEEELRNQALDFNKNVHFLDSNTVTELSLIISELKDGDLLAEKLIDAWIEAFRRQDSVYLNGENPFNNKVHARIKEEFEKVKKIRQNNTNVVDACIYVHENRGWGTLQEIALRNATAADFESAIRGLEDLDILRCFIGKMIDMCIQRSTYDAHFGTATEHFVEACRNISIDVKSPRLASLIKRVFKTNHLSSELEN